MQINICFMIEINMHSFIRLTNKLQYITGSVHYLYKCNNLYNFIFNFNKEHIFSCENKNIIFIEYSFMCNE